MELGLWIGSIQEWLKLTLLNPLGWYGTSSSQPSSLFTRTTLHKANKESQHSIMTTDSNSLRHFIEHLRCALQKHGSVWSLIALNFSSHIIFECPKFQLEYHTHSHFHAKVWQRDSSKYCKVMRHVGIWSLNMTLKSSHLMPTHVKVSPWMLQQRAGNLSFNACKISAHNVQLF